MKNEDLDDEVDVMSFVRNTRFEVATIIMTLFQEYAKTLGVQQDGCFGVWQTARLTDDFGKLFTFLDCSSPKRQTAIRIMKTK